MNGARGEIQLTHLPAINSMESMRNNEKLWRRSKYEKEADCTDICHISSDLSTYQLEVPLKPWML